MFVYAIMLTACLLPSSYLRLLPRGMPTVPYETDTETESGSEGDLVEDDSSGGMNGNSPAEDLLEIPPSVGMASLRVSSLYYRVHSRVLSHTRHTITPAT